MTRFATTYKGQSGHGGRDYATALIRAAHVPSGYISPADSRVLERLSSCSRETVRQLLARNGITVVRPLPTPRAPTLVKYEEFRHYLNTIPVPAAVQLLVAPPERLYLVDGLWLQNGDRRYNRITPGLLGEAFARRSADLPGVEAAHAILWHTYCQGEVALRQLLLYDLVQYARELQGVSVTGSALRARLEAVGMARDEARLLGFTADVHSGWRAEWATDVPSVGPEEHQTVADATQSQSCAAKMDDTPIPPATPRPNFKRLIQEQLDMLASLPSVHLPPYSDAGKVTRARRSAKVPAEEEVLALVDCTLFGSGKDCLVFGLSGVYHRSLGARHAVPYLELPSKVLTCKESIVAKKLFLGDEEWDLGGTRAPVGPILEVMQAVQRIARLVQGGNFRD